MKPEETVGQLGAPEAMLSKILSATTSSMAPATPTDASTTFVAFETAARTTGIGTERRMLSFRLLHLLDV